MSLLSEAMEDCIMLDRVSTADGYGGVIRTWQDGAKFKAAISFNSSVEAQLAAVQGVTGLYTVTTVKEVSLQYHDVFRRVSDGKTYRVTTDGSDNKTPESASLNMRVVRAEQWALTS